MGCKALSTPKLVLALLILIPTHFHNSKALPSDSDVPGSADPKMVGACGMCLPRIQPLLLLIPLSESVYEANLPFLVPGVTI